MQNSAELIVAAIRALVTTEVRAMLQPSADAELDLNNAVVKSTEGIKLALYRAQPPYDEPGR